MLRVPFFYGWIIVGLSALGIFFSGPGQTYSVSVFVDPLIQEFGWSRSLVSTLYSVGTLCAGLVLTFVGRWTDRYGHRRIVPLIAAAFAGACLLMSAVQNPVMLLLGFMLIRLLGQGSMTLVSTTLVPQWFRRLRGRAMSLAALGGAVSTAALPKVNTWLIETYNWRLAWQIWALLLAVIMVPLARSLIRDRPEDLGLQLDNSSEREEPGRTATPEEPAITLAAAMRTQTFWLLLLSSSVPAIINTGLIFHQVSILGARGLAPAVSATVFTVAIMVQLPANFLAGYLLDRIPPRFALAGVMVGHVILMAWILNTDTVAMAVGMGVLRGLVGAFEGIIGGVLWPAYYGRRYLGSIRGLSMTAMVIASALGPLPFGVAFDLFGGYREIILLMMAAPVLAALAAVIARPPQPAEEGGQPAAS